MNPPARIFVIVRERVCNLFKTTDLLNYLLKPSDSIKNMKLNLKII